MSLENTIHDILSLQDVELANAMSALKQNPAQLADFVRQRKGELYSAVSAEHSDSYSKVHGDLVRSGDTIKNVAFYHVRNKDLDLTQQAVFEKAKAEADAVAYDSHIAKRQFEINEWTVGNKRDTLFVLQLMLIGLTLIAPLVYLRRIGAIPTSTMTTLIFLILVAIALTFAVRYQYTDRTRDLRFWNRRRFAQMGGPPTPPTCESVQGLAQQSVAAVAGAVDSMSGRM
jgi:hypothetical protein